MQDNVADIETQWQAFQFDDVAEYASVEIPTESGVTQTLVYYYDYLTSFAEFSLPGLVIGWELSEPGQDGNPVVVSSPCNPVSYLEGRVVSSYTSTSDENGNPYPLNDRQPIDSDPVEFKTSGFNVQDIADGEIVLTGGWYRIPPGHTVWISKVVHTPTLENYSDSEVLDLSTFNSYDPRRYDSRISWNISRQLTLSVVHDAGVANISNMDVSSLAIDAGTSTFTIQP
jgi:hypothetical protein